MSPKKITTADKLEIVDLYRQSGDTTASLAIRYGVSNSTISRLLKQNIPEAEYEILIQHKRGSKLGSEDQSSNETGEMAILPELEISYGTSQGGSNISDLPSASINEDSSAARKSRRRSSAPVTLTTDEQITVDLDPSSLKTPNQISTSDVAIISDDIDLISTNTITKAPIPRTPVLREILSDSENRYSPPIITPESSSEISTDDNDDDEDLNTEDVNVLAAMFGEEIADGEDDDDEDDEDDDNEESTNSYQPLDPNQLLTKDRLHVQITPLSQATLPRTCYIVIDKFAELIVRPLKDFADLGQISGEEVQQRTLPIFDNHRVAKRFSNQRTQRVIKVPDSRVFYKTTQHLKSKGITRLLVDGNIYSLN
jgi:transposase-like protein